MTFSIILSSNLLSVSELMYDWWMMQDMRLFKGRQTFICILFYRKWKSTQENALWYTRNSKRCIFDEMSNVDQPCTKNFPGISYGYLFLWFCPMHGHSYGFHLIAGGEGRKDPLASLFKSAPKDVFYDFSADIKKEKTVKHPCITGHEDR